MLLGGGNDVLNVDGTHTGTTTVDAGAGNDRVFVEAVSGTTTVNGRAGDDYLVVNAVPDAPPATNPMQGQRLTLDGGAGADTDVVGLFGTGTSRIDVVDTGYDGGHQLARRQRHRARRPVPAPQADARPAVDPEQPGRLHRRREGHLHRRHQRRAWCSTRSPATTRWCSTTPRPTMFVNGGSGNDHFRIGQLYTQLHGDRPRVRDPRRRLLRQLARPADQRCLRRGDDQRRHRRRHVRRVPQQGRR